MEQGKRVRRNTDSLAMKAECQWAKQKHNISRIEPDGWSHDDDLRDFGGRIRENISKRSGRVKPFPSQSSDYEIGLLATEIASHARCPLARVQDYHRPRSRQSEVSIVRVVYMRKVLPLVHIFVRHHHTHSVRTHKHT